MHIQSTYNTSTVSYDRPDFNICDAVYNIQRCTNCNDLHELLGTTRDYNFLGTECHRGFTICNDFI